MLDVAQSPHFSQVDCWFCSTPTFLDSLLFLATFVSFDLNTSNMLVILADDERPKVSSCDVFIANTCITLYMVAIPYAGQGQDNSNKAEEWHQFRL